MTAAALSYFVQHADGYSGTACMPSYDFSLSATGADDLPEGLTLLQTIENACSDQCSLEEGEQAPAPKACDDLKAIIVAADNAREDLAIPFGDVVPYFGEVSITWRNGDRMLRVAAFSDARSPRIDFGTTPAGELGDYGFTENATGAGLAEKLAWLYQGD